METKQSELLTRKEVAELLRVSYPTLAQWREKKILPACILGTRIRYRRIDIEAILETKGGVNV